ncbi:helix-turn-helix transcriptional regulator [Halocatena halophila]|uniref:helix-turn-helix transcriptional regulator n=1 Tax=Halocatena halophila TaxID=2814576 RepID=UPI002ED3D319
MPTPADVVEILSKRQEWLPHLCGQALTKPELCSATGVSWSTIDRGVAELERVELVERTTEGFRLTAFGGLLHRLQRSYTATVESIAEAQSMQTPIPTGKFGELVMFRGGDVVLPDPHMPEKPTRTILTLLTEAEQTYGFTPVIHDQYVTTSYERVMLHDLEFEFLITPELFDGLLDTYAEWLLEAVKRDRFELYHRPTIPPFGLTIFEPVADENPVVMMALYAENGLSAVVTNDSIQAVGWASELYRRYRNDGSAVTTELLKKRLSEQSESNDDATENEKA